MDEDAVPKTAGASALQSSILWLSAKFSSDGCEVIPRVRYPRMMSAPRKRRASVTPRRRSPLDSEGWTSTRGGRWIDPVTGRSHTATEAWEIINARTKV